MAVLNKQTMLNLAETAVAAALKQGAAEAEAFAYDGKATMVGIERGQINKTNRIIDRGLAIRVQVNKAIGFAYTNIIDNQATIENTITKALAAAKASKPDSNWKSLPEKSLTHRRPRKDLTRESWSFELKTLLTFQRACWTQPLKLTNECYQSKAAHQPATDQTR